jgi:hypothetical protein
MGNGDNYLAEMSITAANVAGLEIPFGEHLNVVTTDVQR